MSLKTCDGWYQAQGTGATTAQQKALGDQKATTQNVSDRQIKEELMPSEEGQLRSLGRSKSISLGVKIVQRQGKP